MPRCARGGYDHLRPEFPEGGTLYVTNVPFQMSLFFGYVVQPTVQYLYPGEERNSRSFGRTWRTCGGGSAPTMASSSTVKT